MGIINALIGSLRIDVGMNSAKLKKGAEKNAREMRKMQRQFRNVARDMESIGQTMSLALTAPIVGFGAVSLRTAGNFEASMNRVRAALGATDTEFRALSDAAQELGRTTQFSASQAADAIETLAKNGLQTSDILGGALAGSLRLAATGGTTLANASDIATDVMLQFGKTAAELGQVVDGVAGVMFTSKFGIDDYRLALAQAGGVAGGVGVELEDFNAAIAATSSLFASGSDAGTSFKTFLQRLNPSSKEAAKLMEDLGLQFFDATGSMRSVAEIAQELQDSLSGLSEAARADALTTIFGADAMRSAIGLMEQGADGIDRLRSSIAAVSAETLAEARMEGLNGAVLQLRSAFEGLQLAIANSGLLDWSTRVVENLTDFTNTLSALSPAVLRTGTVVAGLTAAIGPLVLAGSGVVRVFRTVAPLLGGLGLAIGGMLGPLGLATVAVGGMAAAVAMLSTRTRDVGEATDQASAAADRYSAAIASVQSVDAQLLTAKNDLQAASERYAAAVDGEATSAQATALTEVQAINQRIAALDALRVARLAAAEAARVEAEASLAALKDSIRSEVAQDAGIKGPRARPGTQNWKDQRERARAEMDAAVQERVAGLRDRLISGDQLNDAELAIVQAAAQLEALELQVDALRTKMQGVSEDSAKAVAGIADASGKAADEIDVAADGADDAIGKLKTQIDGLKRTLANSDLSSEARNAIRQTIAELEAELLGLEASGQRAGGALVDGLASGIRSSQPRLESEVQGIINHLGQMLGGLNEVAQRAGASMAQSLGSAIASGNFSNLGGQFQSIATGSFGDMITTAITTGNLGSIGAGLGANLQGVNAGIQALSAAGSIGTALGSIGAIASSAIPLVGAAIAGFQAVDALIKGFSSKRVTDSGLELSVDGGDLEGRTFQRVRRSKYWGLRKSTSFRFGEADADTIDQIQGSVDAVQSAIIAGYSRLGYDTAQEIAGAFEFDAQRLNFQGKSEEEAKAILQDWLTGFRDGLANEIGGFAGESVETFAVVASALDQVRVSLEGTTESILAASDDLASLAGGSDVFAQMVSTYASNFTTASEQLKIAQDALSDAFRDMGVVAPRTATEFRRLVDAQDLTSEAGRETYVVLLDLSAAFASVYGAIADATGVVEALGFAGQSIALTGADLELASSSLAGLAGGTQNLLGLIGGYRDEFLTAAEREAQALTQLNERFAALGLSVPETVQGFRDLVQAQDLATDEGQATYVSLLGISNAFVSLRGSVSRSADELAALEQSFAAAFIPAGERRATALADLRSDFEALELSMPRTAKGFRELVDAQDKTTASGLATYTSLLGLSGAFGELVGTADNLNSAVNAADGWFATEFDARMAAIAQARGFGVTQEVSRRQGSVEFGGIQIKDDQSAPSLLREMVDFFRRWDVEGMPTGESY